MTTPPPDYCLLWMGYWWSCMSKTEWSGWVQAVGSILAILATGWGVWFAQRAQERQRLRADHTEYTRLLEAVFQLVGGAHQIARKIHDYVAPFNGKPIAAASVRTMRAELFAVLSALERVDVTRLDRFEFVQAVLIANAVVPDLLLELDNAIIRKTLSDETDGSEIDFRAQETAEVLKPHGKLLLDAIDKRGGAASSDTFPG